MGITLDQADDLSLSIRGKLAKTYIFKVVKGKQYQLPFYTPTNNKKTDQQELRSIFNTAVKSWQRFTDSQKNYWKSKASDPWVAMSGYNLYISSILKQGVEVAVKSIKAYSLSCANGNNDKTIDAVDKDRCIVICQDAQCLVYHNATWKWQGVIGIGVLDSTTVRVICTLDSGIPNIIVGFFVVEFV